MKERERERMTEISRWDEEAEGFADSARVIERQEECVWACGERGGVKKWRKEREQAEEEDDDDEQNDAEEKKKRIQQLKQHLFAFRSTHTDNAYQLKVYHWQDKHTKRNEKRNKNKINSSKH